MRGIGYGAEEARILADHVIARHERPGRRPGEARLRRVHGSPSGRPNLGPYPLLLHMPEMAQRLEALRTYLRDEASLSQVVADFTRQLLQHRRVTGPTFEAATTRFGQRGVMTLTNLVACYAVLAYNMNTYELQAPTHPTEKALTP
jgi:hypothetical protein